MVDCAVVDIVGAGSKREVQDAELVEKAELAEDSSSSAQAALSRLPDLYVANLVGINNCKTKETVDPVFDNPGEDVAYGDGVTASASSGTKGQCTGVGKKSASDASSSLSSSSSSSSTSGGSGSDDGQWHGGEKQITNGNGKNGDSKKPARCNDGLWHKDCYGKPPPQSLSVSKQPDDNISNQSGGDVPQDADEAKQAVDNAKQQSEVNEAPKPKPNSQPSKTSNRIQQQDGNRNVHEHTDGSIGDEDDSNIYDYDIDLSEDFNLNRQVGEPQDPNEEEPTPIPSPGENPDSFEDEEDNDIIDNIGLISDETMSYLIIDKSSTKITAAIPVTTPIYDDDGNLLVDVPFGTTNPPDAFLVPVPTGNGAAKSSAPSVTPSQAVAPSITVFSGIVASLPEALSAVSSVPIDDGDLEGFTWPSKDTVVLTSTFSNEQPIEEPTIPSEGLVQTSAPTTATPVKGSSFVTKLPTLGSTTSASAKSTSIIEIEVPESTPLNELPFENLISSMSKEIPIEELTLSWTSTSETTLVISTISTVTTPVVPPILAPLPSQLSISTPLFPIAPETVPLELPSTTVGLPSRNPILQGIEQRPQRPDTTLVVVGTPIQTISGVNSPPIPTVSGIASTSLKILVNPLRPSEIPGTDNVPDSLEDVLPLPEELSQVLPRPVPGLKSDRPNHIHPPTGRLDDKPKYARQAEAPSACSDFEPVTEYVRPPPEWYLSHTPPPSFSGVAGVDSPEDCEDPQWHCGGCRSPNRCVRINSCTRSCTKLPYTTSDSNRPAAEATPAPLLPAPQAASPPLESSTGAIEGDANSCPPTYVGDDTTPYLPCKPGSFLCKSSTQFYTCGQFGGSPEWSYGALRDVAPGMHCEPKLTRGSAKRSISKRQLEDLQSISGLVDSDFGDEHEGGDGVDVDAEALFGDYSGDLYVDLEKSNDLENGWYDEASQLADAPDGVKKRTFRKRQDYEEFQFADAENGGDGIDADPESLFGEAPNELLSGLEDPNVDIENAVTVDDPEILDTESVKMRPLRRQNFVWQYDPDTGFVNAVYDPDEGVDGDPAQIVGQAPFNKFSLDDVDPDLLAELAEFKVRIKKRQAPTGTIDSNYNIYERDGISSHTTSDIRNELSEESPLDDVDLDDFLGSDDGVDDTDVSFSLDSTNDLQEPDSPSSTSKSRLSTSRWVCSIAPILCPSIWKQKRAAPVPNPASTPASIPIPAPAPAQVATPLPASDFSNGANGGDGVDFNPVTFFGDEPADYEENWGVVETAEATPSPPPPPLKLVAVNPAINSAAEPAVQPVKSAVRPAANPIAFNPTSIFNPRQDTSFEYSQGEDGGDGISDLDFVIEVFGEEPEDFDEWWPTYPPEDQYSDPIQTPRPKPTGAQATPTPVKPTANAALKPFRPTPAARPESAGQAGIKPAVGPFVNASSPANGAASTPALIPGRTQSQQNPAVAAAPNPITSPQNADLNAAANVLPYFMGPGPVIPGGVYVDWPGPENLPDRTGDVETPVEAGEGVVGTGTGTVGDDGSAKYEDVRKEGDGQGETLEKRKVRHPMVKRQNCPPVPKGQVRDDQYV